MTISYPLMATAAAGIVLVVYAAAPLLETTVFAQGPPSEPPGNGNGPPEDIPRGEGYGPPFGNPDHPANCAPYCVRQNNNND